MQTFQDAEEQASGLTVAALMDRLRRLDPHSLVVVESGEGGLDCVRMVRAIPIVFQVNRDPDFGPHEQAESLDNADGWAVSLLCRRAAGERG